MNDGMSNAVIMVMALVYCLFISLFFLYFIQVSL